MTHNLSVTITLFTFILIALLTFSCNKEQNTRVHSPDGNIVLNFYISESGEPFYSIDFKEKPIIDRSRLGYHFVNQKDLVHSLEISGITRSASRETWQPVWGEKSNITDHHNEMHIQLTERIQPHRELHVMFRAYNDGIGFRYEMQSQDEIDSLFISDEITEFKLTGDHTVWWIPADYDSYEYLYETTPLSGIDASKYRDENQRPDRRIDNFKAVNTPVTMKTGDGVYLSLHEANLTDYPDMTLALRDNLTLQAELVPWADGIKVKTGNHFKSPWRTIQISETAGGLITSDLILNLNEPRRLEDTSWIEPMKYTGIWWEMHIGKSSWGMGELAEGSFGEIGGRSNHGATTENALRYIDFTAEAGIKGLLIEGWNTGWEYWGTDSLGFFDFTTPYPDFDLERVVQYANEKGVQIIGHHETSGQAGPYEDRLEPAFELYRNLGIHAVKTGYAGAIVPSGETHHGQWMVRHYRKVVEIAARYRIAINAHEPIKDTGIRRTYPNMMTREGVRGMEYNAWSDGNPPEHTTIIPFTRGLAGPTDYTPGIFDLFFSEYRENERVHSTLANQLALYVVIYSPHQMVADLPENYKQNGKFHPAFQFIRDVAVDWDKTVVPDAEIGEYVVIARKEKDSERWFIGAITDENERDLEIGFDFLDAGQTYHAIIYRDADDAHWETNPDAYAIEEMNINSETVINLRLAAGGGAAIHLDLTD
ncbi:MAG: glycoside hydrolase family 97 protein [Balneolaceae bacterium]